LAINRVVLHLDPGFESPLSQFAKLRSSLGLFARRTTDRHGTHLDMHSTKARVSPTPHMFSES
jgi:hypothetical protein